MALLQISEPGQSTAPHRHNLACGIDLGTTNSLVASVISGETKIIGDNNNQVMLPSIVHFGQGRKMTVGSEASLYAQTDPTNTIFSIKRFMGLGFKEVSEFKNCPYQLLKKGNNVFINCGQIVHFIVPNTVFSLSHRSTFQMTFKQRQDNLILL
jgi:molecular chaperone HscA